uniref:DNA repair protein RadC n=1 Tax=Candidatus Kentrum eta TaxID=2126337 RepID=A0A450V325_9GAMM|nr:MAG: DNA repair protein RadC [Candidatus Kentron sp. H]VFJ99168.1 MAG: DNA repair protein RadC [Candidatus Kentron sp. H]VFK03804.1 MAG: DNA repair protein RadC [Candidatus Kentron sp. H]
MAVGGFINASVSPREAFQVAVLKGAVGVMMVHNHADNVLMPSEADKDVTDRFIQAGRILQIDVMDHLIITTQTFLSFAVNGLMDELKKNLKFVPPYEIAERLEEVKQNGLEWGRRKGIREGEEKGRKEVARALLGKGMDINEISEVSGLSEETIRKLAGR